MRASLIRLIALSTVLLFMSAWRAEAQQFRPGDVIVTTTSVVSPFDSRSKLLWYDNAGNLKRELLSVDNGLLAGVAFSPSGVLHVALGGGVSKVAADGTATGFFLTPATVSEAVLPLSFARNGHLYAGAANITAGALYHIDTNGSRVARYDLGSFPRAVDLGSDQCTLFYLTLDTFGRFDVCRGVPLANIATSPIGTAGPGLRVLSDGTFLIPILGRLAQLGSSGQVIRQYTALANNVALDPDRRFVWVVLDRGRFAKLDLTTGTTVLGPFDTGMQGISDITVFGEPRAALTEGPLTAIPLLSPLLLLALAVLLLGAGLFFLRV